jgi:probable HAF family extracellular repeat protein
LRVGYEVDVPPLLLKGVEAIMTKLMNLRSMSKQMKSCLAGIHSKVDWRKFSPAGDSTVRSVLVLVLSLCAAVVASPPAFSQQTYNIADLGTLGGIGSVGLAINASGQVTGRSVLADNASMHAFLYDGTSMKDLGTFGGTYSFGLGINDSGHVTGESFTAGDATHFAFLYDGTSMKNLGTLGGSFSFGNGINASGQVTGGSSTTGDAAVHGFLYDGTSMKDLGTLGGSVSFGNGINASGQVTGRSDTTGGASQHAFLYDGTSMKDLGTLGGTNSSGFAINASGQVTGQSDTTGGASQHAFLYNGTSMKDLGTLGVAVDSVGYGINASGQIVGFSYTPVVGGPNYPFLYSNGTMTDLNNLIPANSGWILQIAYAINDNGWITGFGIINGQAHAFLLTPAAVPFAAFHAQLAIVKGASHPGFALGSTLTLGASSNGINPLTEPVSLNVGTYSVTIPPGKFTKVGHGVYFYGGINNGVSLWAWIAPLGGNQYGFGAAATPSSPATSNPVKVQLTIGDDTGTTSVNATFFAANNGGSGQ